MEDKEEIILMKIAIRPNGVEADLAGLINDNAELLVMAVELHKAVEEAVVAYLEETYGKGTIVEEEAAE